MEASARYFTKLRNLAVFLETETTELQQAHKNPDCDGAEGAVKVLHELRTEVKELKTQVQDRLVCCRSEDRDTRAFMQACLVLKQRTTEDLQAIRRHYERYGYRAPSEAKDPEDKPMVQGAVRDGGGDEEEGDNHAEEQCSDPTGQSGLCSPLVTPAKPPQCAPNPLRTPRLSDFGLSGFHLLAPLGDPVPPSVVLPPPPGILPELPALPELPVLPRIPKTPKCALRMDDEVSTPRLEDFGISEHTMCLNNDFTMDLLRRKVPSTAREEPAETVVAPRPACSLSTPASAIMTCGLEANDVESPQLPALCTPGLKVMKKQSHLSPPPDSQGSLPSDFHRTPEPPAFETPHLKKLLSTVKPAERREKSATAQDDRSQPSEQLCWGAWSHDPSRAPTGAPSRDEYVAGNAGLESFLAACCRTTDGPEDSLRLVEPPLPMLHGYQKLQSQEVSFSSPNTLTGLGPHPKTPEMPDISAFTQDILKLMSQCNTAPNAGASPGLKTAAEQGTTAAGKENRLQVLALVAEEEFLTLPSYLRQMPLSSLNEAIGRINAALEEGQQSPFACPAVLGYHFCTAAVGDREPRHFVTEELKRITGTGLKAHIYFLCLTELKRLEHVQGQGPQSVYRVFSQA